MASQVWGIVLACGKTEQIVSGHDSAFLHVGSHPVITYTLNAFEQCSSVDGVVVVVPKDHVNTIHNFIQMFGYRKIREVVPGMIARSGCIQAAMKVLDDRATTVVIHEVSRPCVTADLIAETVKVAKRHGSGVAAEKIDGSLKLQKKSDRSLAGLDGDSLWQIQSPQAFKIDLLKEALAAASKNKITIHDESLALDLIKKPPKLVPMQKVNLKLVTPDDLKMATAMLM